MRATLTGLLAAWVAAGCAAAPTNPGQDTGTQPVLLEANRLSPHEHAPPTCPAGETPICRNAERPSHSRIPVSRDDTEICHCRPFEELSREW